MLITQLTALDSGIYNVLPKGTILKSIKKHGLSLWTSTFKVETSSPSGQPTAYFLKCSLGEKGRLMMQGEFEASKAIHAVAPDFCPHPIAAGKFSDIEDAYFYICDFVEMTEESPPLDTHTFCAKLANLHKGGKSPTGMFGFHVTTCNGWIPQLNDWEASWATFFCKGFMYLLEMDRMNNGAEATSILDEHCEKFVEVVIPRLLLPLESDGNCIEPCLVHGDLWFGNTATTADRKNQPMIFDPAAFYAHNEYELGNWRPNRNKFTKAHFRDYQKFFQISQPEEEFDDRNRLYSMYREYLNSNNSKESLIHENEIWSNAVTGVLIFMQQFFSQRVHNIVNLLRKTWHIWLTNMVRIYMMRMRRMKRWMKRKMRRRIVTRMTRIMARIMARVMTRR